MNGEGKNDCFEVHLVLELSAVNNEEWHGCGTSLSPVLPPVLPDLYYPSSLQAIRFVQADSAVSRYTIYRSLFQE